jgi:hypothetical protein
MPGTIRWGIADAQVGTATSSVRRHWRYPLFFFFSNRLGCMGSLLISLAATAILIAIFVL